MITAGTACETDGIPAGCDDGRIRQNYRHSGGRMSPLISGSRVDARRSSRLASRRGENGFRRGRLRWRPVMTATLRSLRKPPYAGNK